MQNCIDPYKNIKKIFCGKLVVMFSRKRIIRDKNNKDGGA
jgi:hypothetical protein